MEIDVLLSRQLADVEVKAGRLVTDATGARASGRRLCILGRYLIRLVVLKRREIAATPPGAQPAAFFYPTEVARSPARTRSSRSHEQLDNREIVDELVGSARARSGFGARRTTFVQTSPGRKKFLRRGASPTREARAPPIPRTRFRLTSLLKQL